MANAITRELPLLNRHVVPEKQEKQDSVIGHHFSNEKIKNQRTEYSNEELKSERSYNRLLYDALRYSVSLDIILHN